MKKQRSQHLMGFQPIFCLVALGGKVRSGKSWDPSSASHCLHSTFSFVRVLFFLHSSSWHFPRHHSTSCLCYYVVSFYSYFNTNNSILTAQWSLGLYSYCLPDLHRRDSDCINKTTNACCLQSQHHFHTPITLSLGYLYVICFQLFNTALLCYLPRDIHSSLVDDQVTCIHGRIFRPSLIL